MVKIDRYVWAVTNMIGMALLAVGALIIVFVTPDISAAVLSMAIGILVITSSSIFIYLDGLKLKKEDIEFNRFDEIRQEARSVPNDLEEGYIIDYTAEPTNAISYSKGGSEPCACSSEQNADDIEDAADNLIEEGNVSEESA